MEKATIENMELGNLIFGNSRGEYIVPRDEYQDLFQVFLENNGFDGYGHYKDEEYFENNTFIIRPYYWGEDESIAQLPNFIYKPMNFEIKWYKYPMRDSYSNQDINIETFKNILNDCEDSMKENFNG